MNIVQVSDSELELMRIIWSKEGIALFAEIMDDLEVRSVEWKKNTVLTFLSRLMEKGLLSTRKIGRRNEYRALVTEEDYLTQQTRSFLDKVYEGNVQGLVNTLLQKEMISSDDAQELRKFWNGGSDVS